MTKSFSHFLFFKLITIFPWECWVRNGSVVTLSSVGLWWGSLHRLGNWWCLQMFREMFNGTGSALPQHSCTFIAQLMGTGAENPGCFHLENAWWHVLCIKCLLCLFSTVDLHTCSRSSTFQPSWICSVPSLCVEHIHNLWHILMKGTPGHSLVNKGFCISFWDVQARNKWAPDNS